MPQLWKQYGLQLTIEVDEFKIQPARRLAGFFLLIMKALAVYEPNSGVNRLMILNLLSRLDGLFGSKFAYI
jgi:hypothetical protein